MEAKGGMFTLESINKCWSQLINEWKAEVVNVDKTATEINSITIKSLGTGCVYIYKK